MATVKPVGKILGFLGPVLVLGGLFAFFGYAIFMYKPDTAVSCAKTGVSQQFDIAVHVVRQWVGKETQMYLTCP